MAIAPTPNARHLEAKAAGLLDEILETQIAEGRILQYSTFVQLSSLGKYLCARSVDEFHTGFINLHITHNVMGYAIHFMILLNRGRKEKVLMLNFDP